MLPIPPSVRRRVRLYAADSAVRRGGVARFPAFLDTALIENPQKGEYYLPFAIENLLSEGKARVKVLSSPDKWYGVTYKEDKEMLKELFLFK